MNILGVELEYDFFDADQLEVYERENQKAANDIKDLTQYEGKSTADAIRIQCHIMDLFFDVVFGEGTARRLFHGKANIRDHLEAFGQVAQGAMEARGELDAIEDKYTPNRAERRQEERDKRKAQTQGSRSYHHNVAGYRGTGKRHKH